MLTKDEFEFHPLAKPFPMIEGDERKSFKESIKTQGQVEAILLYQGKILDGRNRYRAGKELDIELRVEKAKVDNDEAARDLVIALNLERRHLTLEQRAFIGSEYANMDWGRPTTKKVSTDTFIEKGVSRSIAQVSKAMRVSPSSIKRARSVAKNPKLKAEVLSGKKALSVAYTESERRTIAPRRKRQPTTMEVHAQRAGSLRKLTPAEVDPNFKGTAAEFAEKYGSGNRTAVELATDRFKAISMELSRVDKDLDRALRMQKGYVESFKVRPRERDIERLAEALEGLEPLVAEARTWLEHAKRLR